MFIVTEMAPVRSATSSASALPYGFGHMETFVYLEIPSWQSRESSLCDLGNSYISLLAVVYDLDI